MARVDNRRVKNRLAVIFTVFFLVMMVVSAVKGADEWASAAESGGALFVAFLAEAMLSLILPIAVLVFLLTQHKDYRFKPWLLPLGCGAMVVERLFWVYYYHLVSTTLSVPTFLDFLPQVVQVCLMGACAMCMLVGSLGNCKRRRLLQGGAIGVVAVAVLTFIGAFINAGGLAYFKIVPQGTPLINVFELVYAVANLLFYIGIFLFVGTVQSDTE